MTNLVSSTGMFENIGRLSTLRRSQVLAGREDAGLEHRRLAAHGDRLAHRSDSQRQIDSALLRDRQNDAAPNGRLEALQLGGHTIVPGQQQGAW